MASLCREKFHWSCRSRNITSPYCSSSVRIPPNNVESNNAESKNVEAKNVENKNIESKNIENKNVEP